MSKAMPKHSLGHKDLGWIFIKASSIERQKTFDVECASIAHLTENCTFEAAMAILEQLREKIYVDFDRTPPATRQDLKDSNA
jgi:threonyl-tRNA synthetase